MEQNDDGGMFVKISDLSRKYQNLQFSDTLKTTYLDSYQIAECKRPVKTTYQAKEQKPRPDFAPLKNLYTLTPYRDPNIPFNLYHKLDPITRGDPRKMQERFDPPVDMDREKVQKSRPKVIMSPATDLDSVKEPFRKIIVDDAYLSQTAKAFMEGVAIDKSKTVKAPLPNAYSKANPISLKHVIEPYVSPEWHMDTVTWDTKQLRAYIDPTKKFWLSRKKPDNS